MKLQCGKASELLITKQVEIFNVWEVLPFLNEVFKDRVLLILNEEIKKQKSFAKDANYGMERFTLKPFIPFLISACLAANRAAFSE